MKECLPPNLKIINKQILVSGRKKKKKLKHITKEQP